MEGSDKLVPVFLAKTNLQITHLGTLCSSSCFGNYVHVGRRSHKLKFYIADRSGVQREVIASDFDRQTSET